MAKKTEFSAEKKAELRKKVLSEIEKTDPAVKKAVSVKKKIPAKPMLSKPKTVKKALPASPRLSLPPLSLKNMEKTKLKKSPVLTVISTIAVLAVLILAIDIFGIYRLSWQDFFSRQVAKIISLPVGTINGKAIRLSDYFSDIRTLNMALENGREGIDGIAAGDDLEERILNRLALNVLMEQKLKQYGQSLSQQELNNAWSDLAEINGEEQIKESVKNTYGLSADQFKEKVLKPVLMKEKLQAIIAQDADLKINQDAKIKAEEALNLALRPGVDFAVLAGQYTQDEAGINTGGDLGWITKGEVSPDLEEILFSINPGIVYGQVVENKVGYHIIKVEARLVDQDSGLESVRARQILIRVDINQYLKELLDQAELKKFVR